MKGRKNIRSSTVNTRENNKRRLESSQQVHCSNLNNLFARSLFNYDDDENVKKLSEVLEMIGMKRDAEKTSNFSRRLEW